MKIYVAGKMQGLPEFGFPLFDKGRDVLLAQGHEVVSPADMDRDVGFDPTGPVTEEFIHGAMRRDIEEILTCDAIAMLPNWNTSGGAKCELDVARRIGLTVFHFDEEITFVGTEVAYGVGPIV